MNFDWITPAYGWLRCWWVGGGASIKVDADLTSAQQLSNTLRRAGCKAWAFQLIGDSIFFFVEKKKAGYAQAILRKYGIEPYIR